MKKFFSLIFDAVLAFMVVFFLLEGALHVFPSLIPISLLVNFQKDARQKIASRLGLSTETNTLLLTRDDGGPPLRIYRPFSVVSLPLAKTDALMGGVEDITVDEEGFCNTPGKAHGQNDIVVVGDSFTWCLNVPIEDSWAERFSKKTGKNIYNLGIPSTSPYDYLQILKHFGISRSPRFVFLNIFEGNDFHGALGFYEYRARLETAGGKEYLTSPCVGLPSFFCFLYRSLKEGFVGRNSYAFNIIANALRDSLVYAEDWVHPKRKPNRKYTVVHKGKNISFNPTNTSDWDSAEILQRREKDFSILDKALMDFSAMSRKYGFTPIVLYTPAPYSAYRAAVTFEDPNEGDIANWFSDEQRRYFEQKTKELGISFMDLTPALRTRAEENEELLYFPVNLHLTRAGHQAVADILIANLGRLFQ